MSLQRRRGLWATFYPSTVEHSARGDVVRVPDMQRPMTCRVASAPDRSAKAEVPGQMAIHLMNLIVPRKIGEKLDIWSRVFYKGEWWDIAAPPTSHVGIRRHTDSYTVPIRMRPKGSD